MVRTGAPEDHVPMTSPTAPRPLTRSADGRLAGVSAGLGEYFGVDPVLFRAAFAATTLLSGAGLLAYLVLWAIVPRTDAQPKATGPVPAAA